MLNLVGNYQSIVARGEEGEVWVQILIFIIIGAIAVLKNFVGKSKPQNDSEQSPKARTPHPQISRPSVIEKYLAMNQADTRVVTERYAEMLSAKPKNKESKPSPQPKVQPQVAESILKPAKPEVETIHDLRLDDADSLRNAIIYHEIFNKPVSLR